MSATYNEIEPVAAAWIRNLIAKNLVAPGVVDERSIKEIQPDELGSGQVHLFAGIAVWSHALRMAGYPDDFPVWSASCPCQPWSAAGKKQKRGGILGVAVNSKRVRGFDDARHLWPEAFRLIAARRPVLVVGEQVASPDGLAWLDAVFADMEGAGYACRAVDICAAGFGAPHIRQRLYWAAVRAVADSDNLGCERGRAGEASDGRDAPRLEPERLRDARRLGHADGEHARGHAGAAPRAEASSERSREPDGCLSDVAGSPGPTNGAWSNVEWLPCRDGRRRPTQPGLFPLAHGATQRMGRLRAYGNAIVAPQAVEFLKAVRGCLEASSWYVGEKEPEELWGHIKEIVAERDGLEAERNEKAAMLTKAWSDIRDVTRRNDVLREEVERRALDREIALRELKEERDNYLRLFNALMNLRGACPRCARPDEVCGQCGIIRNAVGEEFS